MTARAKAFLKRSSAPLALIAAGIAAVQGTARAAEGPSTLYDSAALEALIAATAATEAGGSAGERSGAAANAPVVLAAVDLPLPDIPLPDVKVEAEPAPPPAPTKAPADQAPTLAEDYAVVVELRFERYVLSDGFIAYDEGGRLYVPLGQIVAALDFAITTDPAAGTASGWFLKESRAFSLDLAEKRAVSAGERTALDPADAAAGIDDIYVDLSLVERWFPVTPVYTRSALLIEIASREPLPVEQRLERARAQAGIGRGGGARPVFPRTEDRYRIADVPFVDINVNANANTSAGETFSSAHSIYLAGDLGYMTGEVALNGSDRRGLEDVRLTLSRRDPDGGMFGPLAATVVEIGDIFSPQLTLSGRSARGRGAILTNFPLQRASEFDQVVIRGQMAAGWDAELYRNDVLLAAQSSRPDGLYEFLDVQLVTGENILRVELYGPQGQRRSETRRFTIGEGLVKPGETRFRLSALQNERDIVNVRETAGGVGADDEGELRAVLELEQGLTKRFSVVGSAEVLPQGSEQRLFFGAGFRAAALGAYTRLDLSANDSGGVAAQVATQFDLFGANVLAEHTELFDYESEQFRGGGDRIRRDSDIRLDGSLGGEKFLRLPYALSLRREARESGATRLELQGRLSTTIGPVNASNTLTYSDQTGIASRLTGSALVNTRFSSLSLRANAEYDVRPDARLNSVSAIADRRIGRELSLRGEITRRLAGERETTFGIGVNWLLPLVSLGFDAAYGTDSDFRAGLSLAASFGREPREGVWRGSAQPLARSGAASARVFLDRDLDGKFSDGDEPVEGAKFRAGNASETNADGVALLTGLSAHQPVGVELDIASLADPYWEPGAAGYEIVPRPGHAAQLDFPVYETGEIDGVVYLEAGGKRTPVSNAEIELVDASGAVVSTVKSSFDGFYLIEKVRPGKYALRIAPAQIARLGLVESDSVEIEVAGGEGSILSRDFELRR